MVSRSPVYSSLRPSPRISLLLSVARSNIVYCPPSTLATLNLMGACCAYSNRRYVHTHSFAVSDPDVLVIYRVLFGYFRSAVTWVCRRISLEVSPQAAA